MAKVTLKNQLFLSVFYSNFSFQLFAENRNVVNTLSSVKVYSLQYFPHYLHPNNTLFLKEDGEDEDGPTEPSLGLQATFPVKLQISTDINSVVEENIALKLVQQKNDYINGVAKLTGNYKRSSM